MSEKPLDAYQQALAELKAKVARGEPLPVFVAPSATGKTSALLWPRIMEKLAAERGGGRSAVTLIEVLIVCAIIGVIAGIMLPFFFPPRGGKVAPPEPVVLPPTETGEVTEWVSLARYDYQIITLSTGERLFILRHTNASGMHYIPTALPPMKVEHE
jgi:prepilin-type N-terminal cleavage/methylation domain-containing protein